MKGNVLNSSEYPATIFDEELSRISSSNNYGSEITIESNKNHSTGHSFNNVNNLFFLLIRFKIDIYLRI